MDIQIISEEDFDSLPSGCEHPSPSINLGSHLPNPLFPTMKMNARVAPPAKISGGVSNIIPITTVPSTTTLAVVAPKTVSPKTMATPDSREKRDRINNVVQKEEAMEFAGVTRRKTYEVIARLLGAKKWAEQTDKGGNVRWEWVDDLEKQRQGAEMALKVMGDMIEHKQVEYGIADSTLEKLKALSVDTLRARAAELLDGRRKAIDVTAVSVK